MDSRLSPSKPQLFTELGKSKAGRGEVAINVCGDRSVQCCQVPETPGARRTQYWSVLLSHGSHAVSPLGSALGLLAPDWLSLGSSLGPPVLSSLSLLCLTHATPPPPVYWPGSVWTFPDASD